MNKFIINLCILSFLAVSMYSCSSIHTNRLGNTDLEVAASKPRSIQKPTDATVTAATSIPMSDMSIETTPANELPSADAELPASNIEAFSAGLKELIASSENKVMTNTLRKTSLNLDKLTINKEKLGFFDRIKLKLFNKILNRYVTKYNNAMDTADILAIVSLCAGILTWVAYYGSFLFGIAAIVTGAIALKKGTARRGMAVAGIILGAVGIFFWLMLFLFVISAFAII
jgi:hypothetical protein